MKKLTLGFILLFITSLTYAEIFLNASQGEYFPEYDRFNDELYFMPVKITVNAKDSKGTLKVFCSSEKDGVCSLIKEATLMPLDFFYDANNLKDFSPCQKYYFKAELYDLNGTLLETSSIEEGWPALSPALFFLEYDKAVKASHSRLTLMNKVSNWDKLGTEEISGLKSGKLGYKTSVQLSSLSGVVTMPYKNYSDNGIWILTGSMNTKANIAGNGSMNGTIKTDGMYSGTVCYDEVIIKDSKAGGGYYKVTPCGFSETDINYTYTFYGEEK